MISQQEKEMLTEQQGVQVSHTCPYLCCLLHLHPCAISHPRLSTWSIIQILSLPALSILLSILFEQV